jgi:peptidoglycan/LPS O-acetylase OafA/YrhL
MSSAEAHEGSRAVKPAPRRPAGDDVARRFDPAERELLETPSPSPWNKYRPDIDGLRAFAVLSVLLHHAFPQVIRGGYVGVDVFFVISGFLISSILFAEFTEERFSLTAFYGRRIRRIFPALAVCLAAVLAFGFVYLMPHELTQLAKHVVFGAGFLSNIALWSETGYFDAAATSKPLLHLWSLGVEEQFYILWPALLWLVFRMKAGVAQLLAVLFVASFASNIVLSNTNIAADFYLPVSRFWELLAGAGLAWRRQMIVKPEARAFISLAGLVALLTSVALFTPETRFPGWPALLPVAGAMAIILAGPEAMVNRTVFSNPAVVFVGLISYPLYIWHWPLISYAYVMRLGKAPTPLMAAALLAASFLLAWATYRFIELPVRFGAHRHRRTQIVAACVAVLGVCGLATWARSGFPERFPGLDMRKISEAKADSPFLPTKGMEVLDVDHTIVTHLGHGERKVAFGGDSLLFQYGPRVQQLADQEQLAANTYFVSAGSCAPVPGVIQQDFFAHCANLPGLLADLVRREKVGSVVLGASWVGYSGDNVLIERDNTRLPLSTEEGRAAFYANLEDYVRRLQDQGANVYLVLGPPVHSHFNPAEWVIRGLAGFRIAPSAGTGLPTATLRANKASFDARLRIVAEHTGAMLLDPFPDVCGSGEDCSPFFGAREPKFSDGMHLRPVFVREHLHFLDFLLK